MPQPKLMDNSSRYQPGWLIGIIKGFKKLGHRYIRLA
jgi:hypothetical protein